MIIKIDDELSGRDRKNVLELYPIIYALKKFDGSVQKASKFLGVNSQTLYNKIYVSEELRPFLKKPRTNYSRIESLGSYGQDTEEQEKINNPPLRNVYQWHLHKTMNSFYWNQASEEERNNFILRLKKLYDCFDT